MTGLGYKGISGMPIVHRFRSITASRGALEREVRVVTEWNRLGRIAEEAIRCSLDFSEAECADQISRFSLLKTYLNDIVLRELIANGKIERARELRQRLRRKYASLLREFARAAFDAARDQKLNSTASELWDNYRFADGRLAFTIRLTILELHVAFCLHGLNSRLGGKVAAHACTRIRYCFPPAEIVVICPSL